LLGVAGGFAFGFGMLKVDRFTYTITEATANFLKPVTRLSATAALFIGISVLKF